MNRGKPIVTGMDMIPVHQFPAKKTRQKKSIKGKNRYGNTVYYGTTGTTAGVTMGGQFIVKKGDTYIASGGNNNDRKLVFVPFKGVN